MSRSYIGIIRVTPAGISTLGDNNTQEDACLLQPDRIQGQVVAAWHGQKAAQDRGRVTRPADQPLASLATRP